MIIFLTIGLLYLKIAPFLYSYDNEFLSNVELLNNAFHAMLSEK